MKSVSIEVSNENNLFQGKTRVGRRGAARIGPRRHVGDEGGGHVRGGRNQRGAFAAHLLGGEGGEKIAISFDCAWGTEHTDAILKAMEQNDVKCTFFMVQFWTEKYPEYVKKIDEAGHEIGTHSKTHPYMSKLSESEIREELSSSSGAITAVTGKKVELFRPPYGDYDNLLIDTSNSMGLYPIQWDVDSLDWKNLSATDIAMRIINGVKPGSIILCHNNGLHTAEALPLIFSTLQNRGYEFVPIGELFIGKITR